MDYTGATIDDLDELVQDAKSRAVNAIFLEATDMGRPLYEKYGFAHRSQEVGSQLQKGEFV